MTDKTSTNREALSKIANLVRPALATQVYIPALTHIRFDGDYATAYNDIAAIMIRAKVEVEGCIPGELLIRALNSFTAESLAFQESGKDKALVISSGRSKLKLPILPLDAFPFDLPDLKKADEIVLDRSIMKGIERCLLSVGNDPTHAAQMGVTLDVDDSDRAILYSTDNATISRYQTTVKIKLPGDSPIIMPTFFCQQLVTLGKAFEEDEVVLCILGGALVVEFGKNAKLFNKTIIDLVPMDFPKVFNKFCPLAGLKDRLTAIPDNWDPAFNRAMLVLGGELDKATKITINAEVIKLYSTSAMGDSDDVVSHNDDQHPQGAPEEAVYLDPSLVLRASKVCGLLSWNARALALADNDAQFIHLISYCTK